MASSSSILPAVAKQASRPACIFATAWIAATAVAVAAQWTWFTPTWSLETTLLAILGFLGCARPLRLGSRLEMNVAQPAAFAALLLAGTSTAVAVVGVCTLGAVFLRRRRLAPIKVAFNLAVAAATILAAGTLLELLRSGGGGVPATQILPPLFAATAVAFGVGTLPVAAVAARDRGDRTWVLWTRHFLPMAPGYLAGSGLALLLVMGLAEFGPLSFVFFTPLALLLLKGGFRSLAAR